MLRTKFPLASEKAHEIGKISKFNQILSANTSGSMSTFLPAAISNAYIFINAEIEYAFTTSNKLVPVETVQAERFNKLV